MHFYLSFLDDDRVVQHACEADITIEDATIHWMQIVGALWARHRERHNDWSSMKLWCQGRRIARVRATMLDLSRVRTRQPSSTVIGQNLKFLGVPKFHHWPGTGNGGQRPRLRRHHAWLRPSRSPCLASTLKIGIDHSLLSNPALISINAEAWVKCIE